MILSMRKRDHLAVEGGWATQGERRRERQANEAFVSFLLNGISDGLAGDEVRKWLVITARGEKNVLLHKPSIHTEQMTLVV